MSANIPIHVENVPGSRGISFTAPLVRQILDGFKTQTRRLVKFKPNDGKCAADCTGPQPHLAWVDAGLPNWQYFKVPCKDGASQRVRCPYGSVGDRLWVREGLERSTQSATTHAGFVTYQADGKYPPPQPGGADRLIVWPWKPRTLAPRYCPRWASRITLEITSVRAQRLSDITEEDIIAEGCTVALASLRTGVPWSEIPTLHKAWELCWDSINGKTPGAAYADDPWVWAITFKRLP